MLVIHFSFKIKKRLKKVETKFLGCLILWKQSGDGFSFFFEKNAYHTTPLNGNCMTGVFLMATQKNSQNNFEVAPKFFFDFFSTAN